MRVSFSSETLDGLDSNFIPERIGSSTTIVFGLIRISKFLDTLFQILSNRFSNRLWKTTVLDPYRKRFAGHPQVDCKLNLANELGTYGRAVVEEEPVNKSTSSWPERFLGQPAFNYDTPLDLEITNREVEVTWEEEGEELAASPQLRRLSKGWRWNTMRFPYREDEIEECWLIDESGRTSHEVRAD
tara:strand:+ start:1324 stop:1881 length:558 start_codon:yes stop_codon:yes gene_type:complete